MIEELDGKLPIFRPAAIIDVAQKIEHPQSAGQHDAPHTDDAGQQQQASDN